MIAEELQPLAVPIDSLMPHPENPRRGDRDRIRDSLWRFGQVRPILTLRAGAENKLPDGTIIAGHHVWMTAREEEWPEIAAVRVTMSDEQARAYMVADNRLSDIAGYDDRLLAQVLTDVRQEQEGLAGTGYTDEEVDALLRLVDPPALDPPEPPEPQMLTCPSCGHRFWKGGD